MRKIPRITFFVLGLGIGAVGLYLLQTADVARQKPLCENLELELDMMHLRAAALNLRLQQQDSIIAQFRAILGEPQDTIPH